MFSIANPRKCSVGEEGPPRLQTGTLRQGGSGLLRPPHPSARELLSLTLPFHLSASAPGLPAGAVDNLVGWWPSAPAVLVFY